jgi:hypothetical protein
MDNKPQSNLLTDLENPVLWLERFCTAFDRTIYSENIALMDLKPSGIGTTVNITHSYDLSMVSLLA